MLFLGLLSLFLCGPLGVVAWIMAARELKKIRAGEVSARHSGTVKAARLLGILGTVIFVTAIVVAAFAIRKGLPDFGTLLRSEPLSAGQVNYAGEWVGEGGSRVTIRLDGGGDFATPGMSVSGGRVRIEGDSLSIGLMGISKTWRIDRGPSPVDGGWTMKLDGETFRRKSDGLMV
jgi:hypothetical protein